MKVSERVPVEVGVKVGVERVQEAETGEHEPVEVRVKVGVERVREAESGEPVSEVEHEGDGEALKVDRVGRVGE